MKRHYVLYIRKRCANDRYELPTIIDMLDIIDK